MTKEGKYGQIPINKRQPTELDGMVSIVIPLKHKEALSAFVLGLRAGEALDQERKKRLSGKT